VTKIALSLIIFSISNGLFAMEEDKNADIKLVQLPSQTEIAQRLHKLGLKDFVEKTKINQTLGNQTENAYSTDLAIACAMYMYEDALSTEYLNIELAKSKKTVIVDAILQDHPKSLNSFRENVKEAEIKLRDKRNNKK
jgi:hypothetical protein